MESDFNARESLKVIDEMIARAKFRPPKEYSQMTMMWGYLVMVAALTHWFLQVIIGWEYAPAAWLLLTPGVAITIILANRLRKQVRPKTYVDELVRQVWLGFTVAFVLLYFAMSPTHVHFLPSVLLLYGISLWMQGSLIRFNPYKAGALCCWLAALIGFYLKTDHQLLLLAAAVMFAYIIPGHLLLKNIRKRDA